MAKAMMRAAQIEKAGGDFQLVEKPVPRPAAGQVRIKASSCGICHSDLFVKEPIRVTPLQLVGHRRSIRGWPSGDARDSQDTLEFSALTGVRPTIERFSLAEVNEAYERMISNEARFRVVLEMG